MKAFIFTLALISSQHGLASEVNIWEGSGSLFELQGKPLGTYELVVETTKTGKETVSEATVTLADGTTTQHQCKTTEQAPGKWKSECDHGKGGGSCFGEGLCLSYEEDSNGNAFATTIVMDSPSDMRLLRTELKNGKAVRFFREKLHKR